MIPPFLPALTTEEQATYEWQMWVEGFGEAGQRKLKGSAVLVSRCGGLGGSVAYYLAAAGIGKLVLAHGGKLKPGDLNRQLLMTHDWIDKPRIDSIRRRLLELNPRLEIVAVGENISEANAEPLVAQADLVADCAPLFQERFSLNRASVRLGKPMVECAVYGLQGQVTTFVPGQTPCLNCLCPEIPEGWKRQFPVFGAVSGVAGSLGAMEVIKQLTGLGEPLHSRMLTFDLAAMRFETVALKWDPACKVCGHLQPTHA